MSAASRNSRRLEAVALPQHGAFSQDQALGAGFTPSAIARRVASGEWVRMLPRTYRIAAVPRTWRQRAMAACLWGGESAVLSHRAAGALWQLDGVTRGPVEVTVRRGRTLYAPGVSVHLSAALPPAEVRRVEGIPVTSPERTLIDLAAVLGERGLELALEDALRRGLTTPERISDRLGELGGKGRRGCTTLRRLLEMRGGGRAESVLEVDVERFLRARGLAGYFVRQYAVWDGERWRRLDWAAPDQMVALEADSWRYHGGRRAWSSDRARNDRLEALGWRFVGITRQGVDREPDLLDARIRRALDRAA